MYTFLYDFDNKTGKGLYEKCLSNGEKLVERQLRILQELKVASKIKIAGNQELYQFCKEIAKDRNDFGKLEFEYVGEEIKADMFQDNLETCLLLPYNLLYTKNGLRVFLENPSKYAIGALERQEEELNFQGLVARIDMDWVVEFAEGLQGIDTCPVFPIVKISGELLEEGDPLPSSFSFNCQSGNKFIKSIVQSISSSVKGILAFMDARDILLVNEKEDYNLSHYMQRQDYLERKVFSGKGSIIYVKKIIEEEQFQKVMLVCEEQIENTPVETVFQLQELVYSKFQISSKQDKEQLLEQLKHKLEEQKTDLIVAVGNQEILELVQEARLQFSNNTVTEYPGIKLAAVPVDFENCSESQADFWIFDVIVAGEAFEEEYDKTKIHLLMYRVMCSLLYMGIDKRDYTTAKRLLINLATIKNRFITGTSRGLQAALRYSHTIDYISKFYDSGLEHIPQIIGQVIGINAQTVAAVAIPFLTDRIYTAMPGMIKSGCEISELVDIKGCENFEITEINRLIKLFSRYTTIHYGMYFEEQLSIYSKNLAKRGIWFGGEQYSSYKSQIIKEIKENIEIEKIAFLTIEDIEKVVENILSYSNLEFEEILRAENSLEVDIENNENFESNQTIENNSEIENNQTTGNNLNLENSSEIENNQTAENNLNLENSSEIENNQTAENNLNLENSSEIENNQTAENNLNLGTEEISKVETEVPQKVVKKKKRKRKKKKTLKQRLFRILKKYKLFRDINNGIRKRGRFKWYQFIYPVQTKWIVFESYGGTDNYGCNTRAIYESMIQDPDYFDYKFIWAFNHPKKFMYLKENNPNTVIVKRGTKRYIKFCARSKYIFTNTGMPKYIKPNKEQKMVYTWHGKPLKRIGCSFQGESEGKRSKKQLIKDYTGSGKRLTILTSPSPIFTPIMADAYNLSPEKRKTAMLETGYPRNDFLFKYTLEDVLKIKINLGIPLDKKVILYAPTWRPFKWIGGKKFEHVAVLDLEKLYEELGEEYVFLCRLHHLERDSMHFDQFPGFLYDVSMVEDVNRLYIISDLLISDYSGTVFDFANLCRPIVFFMYDKEEYVGGANGLNFDLDFLPGPITETQEEMTEAVKDQLAHFVYDEKYKKFNEACNCLDGPDCAYRTSHQIVEVNPPATAKQERQIKYKIFGRNTKLTLRGYLQKLPFIKNNNTKRIESFHNKYKGKRCFLIGNGPSLRLADLNMLKDEICFGCNMIYKVFERTDWRPTFLCASDRVVAQAAAEQLQSHPESTLWVSRTAYDLMKYKGDNLIYVSNLRKETYYVHGNMTEYYVPSIATVMTFMIELAMYMGFSEIYLLGVDFTIGRGKNDHFMNSYRDKEMTNLEHKKMRNLFKGENIGVHEAQIRFEGRALFAYEQLEAYAKKHGYHVYNATRGGMLEVFERANLDEVVAKARP